MGALSVPASGIVYVDTMIVIYTVERYPAYLPLLEPMWQAGQAGTIEIVSSELALMECLVGPLKSGDAALANEYEQLFQQPQTRLLPITRIILRRLPACAQRPSCERPTRCTRPPLKTPDACSL